MCDEETTTCLSCVSRDYSLTSGGYCIYCPVAQAIFWQDRCVMCRYGGYFDQVRVCFSVHDSVLRAVLSHC